MSQIAKGDGFYIVYPENKWVSTEWIATAYSDAVANGEIEAPFDTRPRDMALALDDAGIITLGKQT